MSIKDSMKKLKDLDGKEVRVGWFEENIYAAEDGKGQVPVAQVAAWNEFGHVTKFKKGKMFAEARFVTPARPFMREAASIAATKVSDIIRNQSDDVEKTLKLIGEMVLSQIQDRIKNGQYEPNSYITVHGTAVPKGSGKEPFIKGKGFDKPLTHSGIMAQTVQYKIVKS